MEKKKFYLILISLSIVTIIWGLNVIMIKYLSGIFPVVQLSAWRISMAALCLLIFTYSKWKPGIKKLTLSAWGLIFLVGFTSIFLHQLLISQGLRFTSGSAGSLILGLNPLTTSLLAMVLLGDQFNLKRFIGIGLGFTGVLIVVGHPGSAGTDPVKGNLIVFLSMLAYVSGGLLIKQAVKQASVFQVTTFSHMFGALLLLIMWFLFPVEPSVYHANLFAFGVMVFSGCIATALCTSWWNMAISEIGPSKTTLFLNVMPISSLFFAALFLNEKIHLYHALALLLIVAGIYLGLSRQKGTGLPAKPISINKAL
ncbi:DMT family transporter [Fictibacillus sp. S7]|uniref:DMT family transporter n=2 Tax=Fictibacillus sp. S7 TaxID=2212476 RepID=UPI0013E91317|nr:DMT family transporter [Fictibacillus sp. S7]